MSGDVTAYVGIVKGDYLSLTKIAAIAAGTPVVLKGTYYNKIVGDVLAENIANSLKGAAADTEAAGKYVLAKPEGNEVGFYLADKGTIAAGKAYLEGAANVKAFYFAEDDATGIENIEHSTLNIEHSDAIYNVAGQRISKLQKGINIIDGKKVLF